MTARIAVEGSEEDPISMKKWLAPSSIRFFHFYNDISRKVVFRLENRLLSDMLSRTFEPASRDSYTIMVKAPVVFAQFQSGSVYKEDELLKAEQEIEKHESLLHEFLDMRIGQSVQRLQHLAYDPDAFERKFTHYEAVIVTNFMGGMLQLYQKADWLYTLYSSLWLLGELSDKTDEANRNYREFQRTLRKQLHAYSTALHKHSLNTFGLIKEVRKARDDFKASMSERSKAAARGEDVPLRTNEEYLAGKEDQTTLDKELSQWLRQLGQGTGNQEDAGSEAVHGSA